MYTHNPKSAPRTAGRCSALLLEYPDDPGAWLVEDEYMFGSNLLVAPMLEEGSGRDVYLPGRQKWIDYQTGKVYAPGWNHIKCGTLPIGHSCKDGFGHPPYPRGTMHRPDEMGQDYVEEVSGRRKES